MQHGLTVHRGLATTPSNVTFEGRSVAVGAFPIGIDPDKFTEGLKSPKVQNRIASLENKFKGTRLMVSVDRLDYIKGIPQKLHALEVFLSNHPEWVGKVVLVQVAVPSRQDVEEYQNLRAVVNELVGRINGMFGTICANESYWEIDIDSQYRNGGLHAHPFHTQIRQLRRADRTVCRLRRLHSLVNARRDESCILRVYRHAASTQRRPDPVGICGGCAEFEWEPRCQPLEHRGTGRGVPGSSLNG